MKQLKELIKQLYHNAAIRYIFFGGCTTMVNLVLYYILRYTTSLGVNAINVISISCAILFAYVTNANFVFDSQVVGISGKVREFGKFVSARLFTMAIEIGGVALFTFWGMDDRIGKFLIQFVVLVLNFIISKIFVFK